MKTSNDVGCGADGLMIDVEIDVEICGKTETYLFLTYPFLFAR